MYVTLIVGKKIVYIIITVKEISRRYFHVKKMIMKKSIFEVLPVTTRGYHHSNKTCLTYLQTQVYLSSKFHCSNLCQIWDLAETSILSQDQKRTNWPVKHLPSAYQPMKSIKLAKNMFCLKPFGKERKWRSVKYNPFKSNYCPKVFARGHNLNLHIRHVHTEPRNPLSPMWTSIPHSMCILKPFKVQA